MNDGVQLSDIGEIEECSIELIVHRTKIDELNEIEKQSNMPFEDHTRGEHGMETCLILLIEMIEIRTGLNEHPDHIEMTF